jgi:hypothetical protein
MWHSPDGASRFQYPGWQGRLALYCVSGLVFCEITPPWGRCPHTCLEKIPVGLSEAIAVAMRLGHLLDLPQHPHKASAEADDGAQKQQRQARRL